jgi:RHS repeat-associated protein
VSGALHDFAKVTDQKVTQVQSSLSGNIDILSGLWLDDWFASTDSTGSVALLRNALGSTIALVNSSGSIATQDSYEPFGKTAISGSATTNPYAFAGRELDTSGLYFMRARYYNPLLSRFISSDPIGLGGGQANFYGYAANDPLIFSDPSGFGGGASYDYKSGTWTLDDGFQIHQGGAGENGSSDPGGNSYVFGGPEGNVVAVEVPDVNAAFAAGSIQGGIVEIGAKELVPIPPFTAQNANKPPGPNYTWVGGSLLGSWFDSMTGWAVHPDFNHGPAKGPHFDMQKRGVGKFSFRINGTLIQMWSDGSKSWFTIFNLAWLP